ncbi:hypothetical protein BH23CHL2_BH23CHL2_17610 [soil metagenome]
MLAAGAIFMIAMATSCVESRSNAVPDDEPEAVARAGFMVWGASRGVQLRDISASVSSIETNRATTHIEAEMRALPSASWRQITVTVPVQRDRSGAWQSPSPAVIDRLVHAASVATAVVAEDASPTLVPTPTNEVPRASQTPSPGPPPPPPPPLPEGVVYQSDWSGGIDGWIGSPDWQAVNGRLVNDGTRSTRDLWIEAPVQVDPWQAMVIEFKIEAPDNDYGSFGLVARASDAGWYQFGVRWEDFERGSGVPVVTLGASIRQETRRVREEFVTLRWPLTSGPHLFRAEFRDGEARFFVDGREAGSISEGIFVPGEFIGLWSERTPLQVLFFRVTLV